MALPIAPVAPVTKKTLVLLPCRLEFIAVIPTCSIYLGSYYERGAVIELPV
jgi:hypothetical protein